MRRTGDEQQARVLSSGFGRLDELLPDAGLPRGAVIEVAVAGGAAFGSSLALAACRSAQVLAQGGEGAWCAFVDPGTSLHAPAVAAAGVALERLLVLRPPLEALSRVSLRLVEAQVFACLVIDLVGVPGAAFSVPLARWTRIVRRLALTAANTDSSVILLTALDAPRPLPLPVALRLELTRVGRHQLRLQIAKERLGRISGPHLLELGPGLRPALERSSRSSSAPGGLPGLRAPLASVARLGSQPPPSCCDGGL